MKPGFFARNSLKVLMVVAFLMPLMWVGTKRSLLSNSNDVKSWLPAQYAETHTFRWYRQRFESDMFVLVSWEGCVLDSPALDLLARKLVPTDVPATAASAEDPGATGPEEDASAVAPTETPATAAESGFPFFTEVVTGTRLRDMLVEEQHLTPQEAVTRLKGFVIGSDGKQTCLVLTVNPQGEAIWDAEKAQGKHGRQKFLHAVVEQVYEIAESECGIPRDKIRMGGPPVDNVAIDTEGEKSLFQLAGVCAIVGLFMSWWCLRSFGLTAMVFTTGIFSAGLSLAAVFFSGSTMNAILLTMPSLVYVAATSGAIHLANYYRDAVKHAGVDGAADRAIRNAWLPLFLATGTTSIGLVSLAISELVPIRMFGIYSATGVMISLVVLCFYLPAALQTWPVKNINENDSHAFDPGLSPRWRHVGRFVIRRNGWMIAACTVLMAAGAYGLSKVETSVKLMRLFGSQAQILADYDWLEKNLGPLVPMEVVIRIDKTRCNMDLLDQVRLVEKVRRTVGAMPQVGSTLAATTFARNLPARPGVIERRAWITLLDRHREDLRDYLHTEETEELWRVSARVGALTDLDYGEFINDIRRQVEPVLDQYRDRGVEGVSAVYTGLVPLIYKAQRSMLDGLILGFVGDLILIGIAIICLLRDWSAGILLAIPSVFPLVIVFGYMGLTGVVVDVGTVMVPAVALGVTVDDAIHFMIWCRHGQEKGMSRGRSIMFAYGDCARAIYQSWGVIGLGLSAFMFSGFTPTQRFGALMLAMLTVSSVGNLVLL
ncbi:MAG: efflux RND transporter permease subunit, partial [Thermoguttaceae bacterium]